MKKNVGNIDQAIRMIAGIALIIFAVVTNNWWGLIGIVPIITSVIGYCPVYSLFKISSVSKIKTEKFKP